VCVCARFELSSAGGFDRGGLTASLLLRDLGTRR